MFDHMIITQEKEHTKAIVRAYFNGKEAPVAIDTCSNISTIEYKDPKRNRIFKVERRTKCNRLCREEDASAESRKKGDTEITSENDPDEVPQEPSSEGDEELASVTYAEETRTRVSEQPIIHGDSCYNIEGNAMPSPNYSVNYENNINKASIHTLDAGENDMNEGIPMNNEKEATDNIEDNQNIENYDHETNQNQQSLKEIAFRYI